MAKYGTSGKELRRLNESLAQSRKYLAPFRAHRQSHIEEYCGKFYAKSHRPVPRNIIDKMVTVMLTELAAQNPQVMVLTRKRHLKGEAASRQYVLNDEIRRMQLERTVREMVADALFGMGIVKCGISEYGRIEVDGFERVLTRPYAATVDLDNWVHDMSAPHWADVDYMGDRYRLPKEDVEGNDLFNQEVVKRCLLSTDYSTTDEYGQDLVEAISRDEDKDGLNETLRDHVDLWDIYFPHEGKLCTFIASQGEDRNILALGDGSGAAIREVEWEGPPRGPYHRLGFKWVSNNTMPKSPVGDIRDLHDAENEILRKVVVETVNAKSIFGYQGQAANDMDRIRNAKNMDVVRLDHPDAAKLFRFDATNPAHAGMMSYLHGIANEQGGNFDLLGGSGAQTDTLGQDQLLHSSASKMVKAMQVTTVGVVRDLVEDIAFYLFSDPELNRSAVHKIPNTDLSISEPMTQDTLQGRFDEFEFDIIPYSMEMRSPQQRLASVQAFARQAMELMPLLDQQGVTLDVKALMEIVARYSEIEEETAEFFITSDEPIAAADRSHERSLPNETKRTYERVNSKGMTKPGYEQEFQKDMFSQANRMQETA